MTLRTIKAQVMAHQSMCDEIRKKFLDAGIDGPWMTEPDRVEFKSHGLDCILVRQQNMFHWCGYVGVPKSNKYFKKVPDYDGSITTEPVDLLDVHGGITYSQECSGHICHDTDGNDDLFWFGFDCAHSGDLPPYFILSERIIKEVTPHFLSSLRDDDVYRDVQWVKTETERLAKQLAEL